MFDVYGNSVITLLSYRFSLGLTLHFSWEFLLNIDNRYGVKIVFEKARRKGFLNWKIVFETDDYLELFSRLKALGFTELTESR